MLYIQVKKQQHPPGSNIICRGNGKSP